MIDNKGSLLRILNKGLFVVFYIQEKVMGELKLLDISLKLLKDNQVGLLSPPLFNKDC